MRAQDAVALWQALLGEEKPPTVFVGHSMGGAIATWAASRQVGSEPHAVNKLYAPQVTAPRTAGHSLAHSRTLDRMCAARISGLPWLQGLSP